LLQRTQTKHRGDTLVPNQTARPWPRGPCQRAGARAYLKEHMGMHEECAVFHMRGDVAERLKAAVC
jgi:hypothetical protein